MTLQRSYTIAAGNSLSVTIDSIKILGANTYGHVECVLEDRDTICHDDIIISRDTARKQFATLVVNTITSLNGNHNGRAKYDEIDNIKFCLDQLYLKIKHDKSKSIIIEMLSGEELETEFILEPYVLSEEAGSILVGPPKSTKSYVLLLMGLSIHYGINKLWKVRQSPVLFVNFERSRRSIKQRLAEVNKVLGLPVNSSVPFVHARSDSLQDIADDIGLAQVKYNAKVILVDSISQTGIGNLNENLVANAIVDMLNSLASVWIAIAHTPKRNDSTVFGSQLFVAAADAVIQVESNLASPNVVETSLEVTQANDFSTADTQCNLILQFEDRHLVSASIGEGDSTAANIVKSFLEEAGQASVKTIVEYTGLKRVTVAKLLSRHKDIFQFVKKSGRDAVYQLRE